MREHLPVTELARLFESGQVLTEPAQLLTYETDASFDRHMPDAVVFPRSTQDVVNLVDWARHVRVPVIARGAGTGLSGGAIAERGGIIVEFSRLGRILELDPRGRSAVLQPGVINLRLDEQARTHGLYYPPDPASGRSATIGGNVAENAGGPHCFKYGVTTNYVTGLHVVLPDGNLVRFGGRALDYPEFDFVGVMTGSEGTLGIITEVNVRLLHAIPAVQTLMVSFDAVEAAAQAVSAIIAAGLQPATLEMMDREMMRVVEDSVHAGLPVNAAAALIVEADGYPASLTPQMQEIAAILREHAGHDLRFAENEEERTRIWYARKSVGGALSRIAPGYLPVDCTVPRSRIAETLTEINERCADIQPPVAYLMHAGDGNFHPHIFMRDPSNPAVVARAFEGARQIMQVCVDKGGSITGEHGVGTEKRAGMRLMYSDAELAAMQDIKAAFDPEGLMNPGKIFPPDLQVSGPNGNAEASALPAVVSPATLEEAVELVRVCQAANPPRRMFIRGNGIPAPPTSGTDIVLSTCALSGIRHYAPDDLYVTAGAGTRLLDLQDRLRRDGMWVPLVSPWQDSTLGGIVATNLNAPLRMRYGGIRDQVLAVTAILGDGRVIRAGRPVVKNVAGYDLPKLFVGCYGTLGVISEVTLKIAALPRATRTLTVPVETLDRGLECAARLLQPCIVGSALLLCRGCDVAGVSAPFVLLYTMEGLPEDVNAEAALAREALCHTGARQTRETAVGGSAAWAEWLRESAAHDMTTRVGLPPKESAMLVGLCESTDCSFMADVANGHLYLRGRIDLETARRAVRKVGGYVVVHSTPEPPASNVNRWGDAPESLELMRRLKARWDPRGILNPGVFRVD